MHGLAKQKTKKVKHAKLPHDGSMADGAGDGAGWHVVVDGAGDGVVDAAGMVVDGAAVVVDVGAAMVVVDGATDGSVLSSVMGSNEDIDFHFVWLHPGFRGHGWSMGSLLLNRDHGGHGLLHGSFQATEIECYWLQGLGLIYRVGGLLVRALLGPGPWIPWAPRAPWCHPSWFRRHEPVPGQWIVFLVVGSMGATKQMSLRLGQR